MKKTAEFFHTFVIVAFYRSAFSDNNAPDGVGISLNVQVSHNAAKNKTATAEEGLSASSTLEVISEPVSSAYLLVTEAMILAGEAIGRFQSVIGMAEETRRKDGDVKFENCLRLPFRSQRKPGKLPLPFPKTMDPIAVVLLSRTRCLTCNTKQ